jgi:hypothetical protein
MRSGRKGIENKFCKCKILTYDQFICSTFGFAVSASLAALNPT